MRPPKGPGGNPGGGGGGAAVTTDLGRPGGLLGCGRVVGLKAGVLVRQTVPSGRGCPRFFGCDRR